jgi:WD40 repeat protein
VTQFFVAGVYPTTSKKAALIPVVALLLFALAACAPRHAHSLLDSAGKYRPIRLATNLQVRPGNLAWSPDGRMLAFLTTASVNLYDVESTEQKVISIEGPHFLSWSSDNELLALSQEQGRDVLSSIDQERLEPTNRAIDVGAEALYCTSDNRSLLVLSTRVRQFSFGTEIALHLSVLNRADGTSRPLYDVSKVYPTKQTDLRYFLAWTHAGLNPIDTSLLVIELVKPPLMAPYSRIITVDSLTGDITELSGQEQQTMYTSASWSPDGRMVVLSDKSGKLEIQTFNGDRVILDRSFSGFYPTWSPQGDRIFAGGSLIDRDGKHKEDLLAKSPWSIAQWSPDGTKLAVATDNDLWLFNDVSRASVPAGGTLDKSLFNKMSLLQNLFRDGLITRQEYQERRVDLMKGPVVKK